MENKWQLMPKVGEDFIRNNPEYGKIILQLLANRKITGRKEIENFFKADKKDLLDPFLFNDMTAAIELAVKHIKEQNLIIVYGDYDADGVTATAVLVEVLKILKAWANLYIPGRTSEGYGLNQKAIDELHAAGAKLIITVDNGIRNKPEVDYAKTLGLEVIITDHHEPPPAKADWPDCLIINPKAGAYPFKFLAGVGVAYKFAMALIRRCNLTDVEKTKLEERILDLVAIGTVADTVSLIGENRILTRDGLGVINQRKRLGINELIEISQLNGGKEIKAWNISWQIAPRLNSAGRLDHANTAYELLVTKDSAEARTIAKKLNEKNALRQKLTEDIFSSAKEKVDREMLKDKIIIMVSPNVEKPAGEPPVVSQAEPWPEGVMGLVAGRLCELYSRPAIVITKFDKEIKGSGRSIDEFNIMAAIENASEFLEKYGGHAAACGFTLKSHQALGGFIKKMKQIAFEALRGVKLMPKIMIEAELDLADINEDLVDSLEKFEPFGEDNERPKFLSRNLVIQDKTNMGAAGQHVKFRFGGFDRLTPSLWAVAFSQAENYQNFKIGDQVEVVYYMEFNEFNGRKVVQLKIIDMKKVG